jgi:hypothetical protein
MCKGCSLSVVRISAPEKGRIRPLLISCGGGGKNIASAFDEAEKLSVDVTEDAQLVIDATVLSLSDMDARFVKFADFRFVRELRRALQGHDCLMIVAGLGGIAGGGACEAVARIAAALSVPVIASVAMPFNVEGAMRRSEARRALGRIESAANITICFDNNMVMEGTPNLTLSRALAVMNRIIVSPLEEISIASDMEWFGSLKGRHYRGSYSFEYITGGNWQQKAAAALLSKMHEAARNAKKMGLFVDYPAGSTDDCMLLAEEFEKLTAAEEITVFRAGKGSEARNRISAIALC